LDGDQPSALAIVRSLGRQGVTVHVASSVERPLAASSRYAGKPVRYPDPLRDGAAFVAWIQARQQQHPHELIFPVTERTVVPLMLYRAQLDEQRLAIAPTAALEQVLAKDKTMAVAESLQIPIPKSVHVSNLAEASDAAQVLGYPLVIKPARSVGQDASGHVQLAVSYAQTPAELKERVAKTLAWLATVPADKLDGNESRDITFPVGRDKTRTMKGEDYLRYWMLPNFYFHVTTAYAILRHNGVELGKQDYLTGGRG
jgi:predicted ATP-grasp superfamily ATP-dependent carboligase